MKLLLLIVFSIILFSQCNRDNSFPDPLEAGWKGKKVCKVLKEDQTLRVLKCTFPPGVGHEKHFHAKHFAYTLKGSKFRITDEKGTREVDVPTGYDYFNEGIECHNVLNIGDSTGVFLIIEPK
jgi:quercetin dioxygenase-like cupin family protein